MIDPYRFGVSATPLLDTYSGAVAAWSIARRLKNSATGAFRLARLSDGVQQDFTCGTVDNDISGAQTFIGASTGYVVTLYDQVSTWHLSGTTTQNPLISAGTLNVIGSRAQIVMQGTNALTSPGAFGTGVGLSGNPAFSVFAVYRKTTNTNGSLFGWGDTGTSLNSVGTYDDGTFNQIAFAGGNGKDYTAPSNNTQYMLTLIKTAGAINSTTTIYRNGSNVTTAGGSANTPSIAGSASFIAGQWAGNSGGRLIGGLQELIVFASDQSANRAAIEADMRAYYGF